MGGDEMLEGMVLAGVVDDSVSVESVEVAVEEEKLLFELYWK